MGSTLGKYLHSRPGSPNWYVRLPVPTHLQAIEGRVEIPRSMKTSDLKLAEERAIAFIAEQRERFKQLELNQNSFVPEDLHSFLVQHYFDGYLAELRKRISVAAANKELDEFRAKRKLEQQEWLQLSLAQDYRRLEPIVAGFLKGRGYSISADSEQFKALLPSIMEAVLEALNLAIKQMETGYPIQPQSSTVLDAKAAQSKIAEQGERIADYLTKYIAEEIGEYGRNPSNLKQAAAVIETFAEWIGTNRNISSITKKEAAAFREVISAIPKGRGVSNELAGLSLQNCIAVADKNSLPLLSPATKGRYISDLSSFFKWLIKQGACNENIWTGLNFKVNKQKTKRPSFTAEQLHKLLASPLYSGFLRDKKEHISGAQKANDWRHWIPLLCMFTGARITEIAQLYVDDVEEVAGCLIGHIRYNEERGQSVKTKTGRLIVFHSTLLAAGFKEFWQAQTKRSEVDGNERLFPELKAKGRPELGTQPAKWFRIYLERIGIKTGADGLGAHSFRHTLSDEMRRAGYLNAEFGFLVMGHSDRSMTARYGGDLQGTVERLAEMIEKVKFEGVDFSTIVKN